MRITTWNCRRGNQDFKLSRVLSLQPTIASIQEITRPRSAFKYSNLWVGKPDKHGVLLFGTESCSISETIPVAETPKFFLPAHARIGNEEFNVLAVWVYPDKKNKRLQDYIDTLLLGFQTYQQFILSKPTVILGDFNANLCVTDLCKKFGLISAYHEFFNATIPNEDHPTYYMYHGKSTTRKFECYIDFCLLPKAWKPRIKVTVGERDWLNDSDHVPVLVDLK